MSISQNNIFKIDIDNFSGPLDLLLDLAKSQKVDLANTGTTTKARLAILKEVKFIFAMVECHLEKCSNAMASACNTTSTTTSI